MLDVNSIIVFKKAEIEEIKSLLSIYLYISVVGHQPTAEVYSDLLGYPIAFNRVSYTYKDGDVLVVGQLHGRLPEGTVLNKGELQSCHITWWIVRRVGLCC